MNRCLHYYDEGNHWVADFDLAAFYDTISHDLLFSTFAPRGGSHELLDKIGTWLKKWTAADGAGQLSHGIPQGPIASDFLAECCLLPLDEALVDGHIRYVRYVDDIRIFARSQLEAQSVTLQLEAHARNLGLIPQASKFGIKKITSRDEIPGRLPSLAPPAGTEEDDPKPLSRHEAERILRSALKGRPLKIENKSHARYALFRAPQSEWILQTCLRLLERHPEEIDTLTTYFENYRRSYRIVGVASNLLEAGIAYDHVRGALWHTVARLGSLSDLTRLLPVARADLKDRNGLSLRWGVLSFLLSCQKAGLARCVKQIQSQSPHVQALLIPAFTDDMFTYHGGVRQLLQGPAWEPGVTIAPVLNHRRLKLQHFGLRVTDLPVLVQHAFRAVGLIKRTVPAQEDEIGAIVSKRYGTRKSTKWKNLLGPEYDYALGILLQAERLFDSDPSFWLQNQNSFNDAVTRRFLFHLVNMGHVAGRSDRDQNGRLIDFGVLLDPQSRLSADFPHLTAGFRAGNDRRNKLPTSHPYQKKTGSQNIMLKRNERNKLVNQLNRSYTELIAAL